jgi:hypothetical protein
MNDKCPKCGGEFVFQCMFTDSKSCLENQIAVLERALENAAAVIRGERAYSYMPNGHIDTKWLYACAGAQLREEAELATEAEKEQSHA